MPLKLGIGPGLYEKSVLYLAHPLAITVSLLANYSNKILFTNVLSQRSIHGKSNFFLWKTQGTILQIWIFNQEQKAFFLPWQKLKWQMWKNLTFVSFSSHFSFFVLVDKSYEKRKYYVIVCFVFFLLFFIFILPVLPWKRKTLYRK